jgi:hypothetical protein
VCPAPFSSAGSARWAQAHILKAFDAYTTVETISYGMGVMAHGGFRRKLTFGGLFGNDGFVPGPPGSSRPEPDVYIRFDERPDRTKAANQPY